MGETVTDVTKKRTYWQLYYKKNRKKLLKKQRLYLAKRKWKMDEKLFYSGTMAICQLAARFIERDQGEALLQILDAFDLSNPETPEDLKEKETIEKLFYTFLEAFGNLR